MHSCSMCNRIIIPGKLIGSFLGMSCIIIIIIIINFYFSDISVYTPSRHHGLQVTNINNIVMSYVLKTYCKEVWLFYHLGSA